MAGLEDCYTMGAAIAAARKQLAGTLAAAKSTAIATHQLGVPEAAIASAMGVSRNTIREWRQQ